MKSVIPPSTSWTGSVLPPSPLDEDIKSAFPGIQQRSGYTNPSPQDRSDYAIRCILVGFIVVTFNLLTVYFGFKSSLYFVLLNALILSLIHLSLKSYAVHIACLALLSFVGSVFPLAVFHEILVQLQSLKLHLFIGLLCILPTCFALPVWITHMLYRKPKKITPRPPSDAPQVPVDILITTYKEPLDEILGTVAATQNLDWNGPVNVYVLDDARRDDVRDLCDGLTQTRHPVTRITRLGNSGGKAGNLNNFLRKHERTADFFVTLDCDMRPFPNMLQLLFAAYYELPDHEKRRLAFISTPQYFRNYDPGNDTYDMTSTMFSNTSMPAMHTVSTVLYIGTSALLSRDAIERCGYFFTKFSTEDSSTGCRLHYTENEAGEKYISKYLAAPVAAGLSPRTLAQLLDQRMRWFLGMAAMSNHFQFYTITRGLLPTQRFIYFCIICAWLRNMLSFLSYWFTTVFFNLIAVQYFDHFFHMGPVSIFDLSVVILFYIVGIGLTLVPWLLTPGPSIRATLRALRMQNVYVSAEIPCLAMVLGYPVRYKWASQVESARWTPHFFFHFTVYSTILASALLLFVQAVKSGTSNFIPYLQCLFSILLWTYNFYPIVLALSGHQNNEHPKWLALEKGREDLHPKPVWAENEGIMVEQLKRMVCNLYNKLDL